MKGFSLKAPAKINLTLEILRRRPDGYHDLRSLMVPVSLYDRLSFSPHDKLQLTCSHPDLDCGPSNLVMKAALALRPFLKHAQGARIHLQKNAPLAAGLGSGSSDAAATLVGLNRLWKLNLKLPMLERLAAKLGSDVPLFLKQNPCVAWGRGEKLLPLKDLPGFWAVLINPGFQISTAWAYKNFKPHKGARPDASAQVLACWKQKDWKGMAKVWANDLRAVAVKKHPAIKSLIRGLLKAGAEAAAMSGSGPTVFGLFRSRSAAQKAAFKMKKAKFCRAVKALV